MNRSTHRASCTGHIGFSSGFWKRVARGTGLDSPRPNIRLSCIPFCVSCHLNIFLRNTSPVLSIDLPTAQRYPRAKQLRGVRYTSNFLKNKRESPVACSTRFDSPRPNIRSILVLLFFGPAFRVFLGHAGSAVVYLGDLRGRNTLERINCSANAKPSVYSWCVHLFKQIYSVIWHKHRESSGRGVRYGTYTSSDLQARRQLLRSPGVRLPACECV
jgi:hypothetical protein